MKRARVGIMAAAIFAVASVAFAQKPDFSGTWTVDPEASGMAGGAAGTGGGAGGAGARGGMGGGGPITIKQTADALTVERTQGENKIVTTYNLTGKEQENTGPGRGGATATSKFTSKWDGNKLITSIVREGANGPVTSTETRWIDGVTMVVETTGPGRDGTPQTRKTVFKKTT